MFWNRGIKISSLPRRGSTYFYKGKWWTLNKPVKSTSKGKKMMVLATKGTGSKRRGKIVHFGDVKYGHNYSKAAKKNYLARSAGIRNKQGKLTKDDPWSANYWARKVLWPKNKPVVKQRRKAA